MLEGPIQDPLGLAGLRARQYLNKVCATIDGAYAAAFGHTHCPVLRCYSTIYAGEIGLGF